MKRALLVIGACLIALFVGLVPVGATHGSTIDYVTVVGPTAPPNACTVNSWGRHGPFAVTAEVLTPNGSCSGIGVRLYYYDGHDGQYKWAAPAYGSGTSCGLSQCQFISFVGYSDLRVYLGRRVWQEGFGSGMCWADTIFNGPTRIWEASTAQICLNLGSGGGGGW